MAQKEVKQPPFSYVPVTEQNRLNEARESGIPWKKWGPYLSERQWGTVREDYSTDGNAWKERMFGLTNSESNHGEDVKEYYFYLDSTPTHSYMKYLYKYPQGEFPYRDLLETNRRRSREEFEYELLDTGIFDEDRYFDVFVEYAKADPEDTLIRISVHNRGPETAQIHVLPTLWFRNTCLPVDATFIFNQLLRSDAIVELVGIGNAAVKNLIKGIECVTRRFGAQAWATYFLYTIESELGRADLRFLERSFQGLMLNFNWWVNRKDPQGRNVFAGGFLGLDNIGVFDRSAPLPTGGHLDQADGTAWMAFYCQCMLEIALILTDYDTMYEEIAYRFLEYFAWITYAMDRIGTNHDEMWDTEDGFFYDLLHLPNGDAVRLKIRSMVGLLPLCAATVFEPGTAERHPRILELVQLFRKRHPEVMKKIATADDPSLGGYGGRRLTAVCQKDKLRRILAHMLDENEFLSPYGIRSLSKYHLEHPFVMYLGGQEFKVQYLPAESNTGMFGGNSNWRGPIWMPVNGLLIRALLQMYPFYGPDFKVECPTGSGNYMTLFEIAKEIGHRLSNIFLRDADGKRPVYGGTKKFQEDPHWRDYILFYEYFHGDNGAGLGASHQTGWTGLIARTLDLFARIKPEDLRGPPKE